ncbi:hypothetical protein ACWF94_35710 [Streptomyces sp. NPDC055078]
MSAPPPPSLKSLTPTTGHPPAAEPPAPRTAAGGPKDAARRASASSVRPDPHPRDGRYAVAWLTITTPRRGTPTATSTCACGRNTSATGHTKVLALITDHTHHRTLCTLRTTEQGEKAAA